MRMLAFFNTKKESLRAPAPPVGASLILTAKLMIYRVAAIFLPWKTVSLICGSRNKLKQDTFRQRRINRKTKEP